MYVSLNERLRVRSSSKFDRLSVEPFTGDFRYVFIVPHFPVLSSSDHNVVRGSVQDYEMFIIKLWIVL